MQEKNRDIANEIFEEHHVSNNRPLFSEETTKKILSHMNEKTAATQNTSASN